MPRYIDTDKFIETLGKTYYNIHDDNKNANGYTYDLIKRLVQKEPPVCEKTSWDVHTHHIELLKEFYHFNKYIMTEPMKDSLMDAIECMRLVRRLQGREVKDDAENL